MTEALLVSVTSEECADAPGFVGVVRVGDVTAYRTIRAHPTPEAARDAVQQLLAGVLGELLAGRDWCAASEDRRRTPRRSDAGLRLVASHP